MSPAPVIHQFESLPSLAGKLRNDLVTQDYVIMFAYNGIGKTRLSREFKDIGKAGGDDNRDTLYFNAYTEDLFVWDNDLENDTERILKINSDSNFFSGFKELALEEKIFSYLERYARFNYKIDYENWFISFEQGENTNIKISRGEETIFKWCVFLALCELTLDGAEAYDWVKYFFIDDPVSSLDDNNAIAIASDLSQLLIKGDGKIKTVISTHHILFFNVLFNELKKKKSSRYFLYKNTDESFTLRKTNDTPFFNHVASLSELKHAMESGSIKTFHFNILRSILEKTSSFFGFNTFGKCIHGIEDNTLFERALNLLSHGRYSIYEPVEMSEDNKDLFKRILGAFLEKYQFELPELLIEEPLVPGEETAAAVQAAIIADDETTPAVEKVTSVEERVKPLEEAVASVEVTALPIEDAANSVEEETKPNEEAIKTLEASTKKDTQ
jgi:hypothetical protein